jgi:hypothetical protein
MMAHCRPQASFTESSEKIFLAEWYFVTKLGPQVSLFLVPIFGVNSSTGSMASKKEKINRAGSSNYGKSAPNLLNQHSAGC